jgi:transformation/transcription domain-associated protein
MFFRDQLIAWPWRRMAPSASAAAGGAGVLGPTPADVRAMARANTDEVLKRLPCIAPTPPRTGGAHPGDAAVSVQRGVLHLVEAALNPKNLCRMEPTWAAWL